MLNRRFLRVKVLQEIYACHQSEETDLNKAEKGKAGKPAPQKPNGSKPDASKPEKK